MIRMSMHSITTSRSGLYKIIKSKESFGGGLILIGPHKSKKDLQRFPDISSTIDGVGRPSTLTNEADYVQVRHLLEEETLNLDKGNPTIQKSRDDVKGAFRSADTFGQERNNPRHPQKAPEAGQEKACHRAAFPKTATPSSDKCRDTLLPRDRLPVSKIVSQVQRNKECMSRQKWRELLPSSFHLLPIYAVRVQWKISTTLMSYTLELVHTLLSRVGEIVSMGQVSPNSAVIVFRDVETANRAVKCASLGLGSTPLIRSWWYPEMWNYTKMTDERRSREVKKPKVILDDTTLLKMQFRSMQDVCLNLFRKYVVSLSYDLDTYNP